MAPADVRLRPAVQADSAVIRRMIRAERLNPTGIRWQRFVVAGEAAGSVIGCAQIKPHRDGSRELASLVVAPEWRGRGLARALIEHQQREAGPPLWLTCRPALTELYRRFGFRSVGANETQPRHFLRIRRLFRTLEPISGFQISVMLWDGAARGD